MDKEKNKKGRRSGSPLEPRAKRFLLFFLLSIVSLGCCILLCYFCISSRKPNIVLVVVDTLRADHLGCYGYFRDTTPFLDSFSKEGILFSQSLTVMSHTLPSHVSIFTGKYPRAHKVLVNGSVLSPRHPTLAQILKENGYTTAAAVGSEMVAGRTGLNRGFDYYDDNFPSRLLVPMQHSKGMLLRYERNAEEVNRSFFSWLDSQNRKPFFAWLHYWDPHFPFSPPPTFQSRFTETGLLRGLLERKADARTALEEGGLEKINGYDNEVAYVDFCIQKLMEGLRKRGLYEDSLILITADHGEGLGEHGYWSHGLYLFEEQVQVPLILRLPRGEKGGASLEAPVIGVDLMPTILDCLGIDPPEPLDGISLLPLVQGEASFTERDLFLERRFFGKHPPREGELNWAPGEKYCLRTSRWKYFYGTEEEEELYDLSADPGEMSNRASAEREVAAGMNATLQEWLSKYPPDPHKAPGLDERTREAMKALGYIPPEEEGKMK